MTESVPPGSAGARNWPLIYLGVFLTTLATLLLELALTRIFSVVFYYHFAFLAISVALFGLGAGGVFSYVAAGWRGTFFAKLGVLSAATAVTVIASLAFILSRSSEPGNLTLAPVYFASALPFFLAGAIVSLAIGETVERVDRVYFFDLLGAAAGCLLLIPLLNLVGGPGTVLCAALLFAAGSAVWFNLAHHVAGRIAGVALALVLAALVPVNAKMGFIDVRYAKGQTLAGELFVKWNSFSRIAVGPEQDNSGRLRVVIDADAATGIAPFDFSRLSEENRRSLLRQGPSLPYLLRPGAKALIIGPGGGWDVARALASGSKDVTGIEINPIIARTVMQERFADVNHGLYRRPEVRIVVEDGRSYIRRSTERFQVVQATLVDTWASTAAGAFALSENNLYTTEAFVDYLTHLTDDGLLSFTRWGFDPPRESLRLLTLARAALQRIGESNFARHVIVAREAAENIGGWGAMDTVVISRKPLGAAEVRRARAVLAELGMEPVYLPGDGARNAFGGVLTAQDTSALLRDYPYDVSPVSDNRPFFFYTVQAGDLWNFLSSAPRQSADFKINRAVPLLFGLVGISIVATVLVLALPPLLLGERLPRDPGAARFLWYFVAIGAGYILIQVALIQKFVLFLGHPTYALTVIIFSMLVSSGLGSYYSGGLTGDSADRLQRVLALVAASGVALGLISPPLTTSLVWLPVWTKSLLTAALIAPAGFLMGVPFPAGLRRLREIHAPSIRWAWSLNAAASVLGSAASIFLAIYLGLRETLLMGGLAYFGALAVVRGARTTSRPEPVGAAAPVR